MYWTALHSLTLIMFSMLWPCEPFEGSFTVLFGLIFKKFGAICYCNSKFATIIVSLYIIDENVFPGLK